MFPPSHQLIAVATNIPQNSCDCKPFYPACRIPWHLLDWKKVNKKGGDELIKALFLDFYGTLAQEDARSYKPRRELFDLALRRTGLQPGRSLAHRGLVFQRCPGSRGSGDPGRVAQPPWEAGPRPLPVRPLSAGAFDGAAFLILDAAAPMRYTDTAFDKGTHFRRALWRYSHR